MTTIVDALTEATSALEAATAQVLTAVTAAQALHDATVTTTSTTINNFLARPAVQNVWIDPINGNDANDGATAATPKKDFDGVIAGIGTTVTTIFLLNDVLVSKRQNVNANLSLIGAQVIAEAPGFKVVNRKMSFLSEATDSPAPGIGEFCSGLWLYGVSFTSNGVDYEIPDVPTDYVYQSVLESSVGTTFSLVAGTITGNSPQAGYLIEARLRSVVQMSMTYGPNAPGHIFLGVAAGSDPNSLFNYVSSVTSG